VTERLEDVKARLGTVDQLDLVITAMRSIAAARARQARERVDGIRTYERTIGTAIGEALALLPEAIPPAAHGGRRAAGGADVVIALTAEQGFAGAFSARILERARVLSGNGAALMLVGDRGLMLAGEMGLAVAWSAPMAAHADEVPSLADRIADALYARLAEGGASTVKLVHAEPGPMGAEELAEHRLLPFDFSRFPGSGRAMPPLVSLPPARLAEQLAEQYVFAELCAALMLSYAAENEARMRAMVNARGNVQRTRETLRADYRRLRQEQITTEIVELATGRAASR